MAMEAPTQNTAIVAGTTAGKFTWSESVKAVTVDTRPAGTGVGQDVFVKFFDSEAELTDENEASATSYDIRVGSDNTQAGDKSWTGVSERVGLESIKVVSVWVPTGGTVGSVHIVGGLPGV